MKADLISETELSITEEAVRTSATNILPAGTVVIATRVGLGKVCIVERATAINQDLRGLVPFKADEVHSRFLFWWLKSIAHLIVAQGTGATVQGVKTPFVASLPFPKIAMAEQQRIVAILDETFDGVDASAANASRNVLNATELFQTSREALFTTRDATWTVEPIAAICENLDGRRRPVTKRDRISGDVPYYGASGVVDHVREHLFDEELLLVSEDGANLVARTYPIAFSISGRSWVNNHAHVLRFADQRTQKFVEHYLNSIDLEPYVTGMAQPKLNQGALNKILVPMPPLERQKEIVESLHHLHIEAQNLRMLFERKILLLAELKQSLLARAFSGELTRKSAANDDGFATPAQAANILAFMQWRHDRANRSRFFGRVMAQKSLDLVERVGGVELGRRPYKDAAGPNDKPHMTGAEVWARDNGFFEFVERAGGGYGFKKLANYGAMLSAARIALKPIEAELARVADILVGKDKIQAEIFATVLAAWNNLIIDGKEATEVAILREARDDWHPDKVDLPIAKFRDAIREIRRLALVPDGTAKAVRHKQAALF